MQLLWIVCYICKANVFWTINIIFTLNNKCLNSLGMEHFSTGQHTSARNPAVVAEWARVSVETEVVHT